MNAKLIAAVALSFAATASFAAETPAAATAVAAKAPVAAAVLSAGASLNLPTVEINKEEGKTRAEVSAEAAKFLATRKSTLAEQLDQLK